MSDLIEFLTARLSEQQERAERWADDDTEHFTVNDAGDELLREVIAKRAIIALHKPTAGWKGPASCDHCASLCHSYSGLNCEEPIDAPFPCPNLRIIASTYSGHPDWREEWARDAPQ